MCRVADFTHVRHNSGAKMCQGMAPRNTNLLQVPDQTSMRFPIRPPIEPICVSIEASYSAATLCQVGGGSLQHGQAGGGLSFRAYLHPDGSPHQHAPPVSPPQNQAPQHD
eukprot:839088-Pelagomonas_calceolata.AAC.6